jgi:hypothetical protein
MRSLLFRGGGAMLALAALLVACCCVGPARAIYPGDHWTYSTEITSSEQFSDLIHDAVTSPDGTLMVRWIASEG